MAKAARFLLFSLPVYPLPTYSLLKEIKSSNMLLVDKELKFKDTRHGVIKVCIHASGHSARPRVAGTIMLLFVFELAVCSGGGFGIARQLVWFKDLY